MKKTKYIAQISHPSARTRGGALRLLFTWRSLGALLLASSLLAGCTKEPEPDGGIDAEGYCDVTFTLSMPRAEIVENEAKGTRAASAAAVPATRAVDEQVIRDLWLVQYSQSGLSSSSPKTLQGKPQYISGLTVENGSVSFKARVKAGAKMYLDVLANTGDPELLKSLNSLDLYPTTGQIVKEITSTTGKGFPADTSTVLPMRGMLLNRATVGPNMSDRCVGELSYIPTLLNVELDLTKLPEGASFEPASVQVRQVSQKWDLFDYRRMVQTTPSMMDLEPVLISNRTPSTFSWYILNDNHLKDGTAERPWEKTDAAIDSMFRAYCTYIEIKGSYRESTSATATEVIYRLWPGGNNTNDYNLLSGYRYDIVIAPVGASRVDMRVTTHAKGFDLGIADPGEEYESGEKWKSPLVRANSAMVKPGEEVIFDVADRVKKANTATQDLNLSWALGTDYTPLLIWEDVPELVPASELKYDKTKGVLTVTTDAAKGSGNAVVGLFPSGTSDSNAGTCIWSWHVWVTDYQPDGTVDYGLEANQKAVVNGGQVHTYGSQFMAKNPGKVIMDRNLGATKTYYDAPEGTDATVDQSFGMFYQWGRKDPFPRVQGSTISETAGTGTTIPIYGPDGNVLPEDGTGYKKVAIATAIAGGTNTLAYSVKNPLAFIFNGGTPFDWYTNASANQNNTLWGDGAQKSVYDPCPEGWRIAPNGTWSDFTRDGTIPLNGTFPYYIKNESNVNTPTEGGGKYYATNGRLYKVSTSGEGTPLAWYPAPGYRHRGTGALTAVGNLGYSWSSAVGGIRSLFLDFGASHLNPSYPNYRAYGFQVRCIQE